MTEPLRLVRWSRSDEAALSALTTALKTSVGLEIDDLVPRVPSRADRARDLLRHRRWKRREFGEHAGVLTGTGWLIALELYLAGRERRTLAVTAVAYAIEASVTTTLRSLGRLEDSGLVGSEVDPADARVRRVGLTPTAMKMMDRFLDNV